MSRIIHFFGEEARYTDAASEVKAREYLEMWKENLLWKIGSQYCIPTIVDHQWVVRGPEYSSLLSYYSTMALKLSIEFKFLFEIDKNSYLGWHKEES